MSLVQLQGITQRYNRAVVLDNVDLEIANDEFVALQGRSGSGKSTLLRILSGLEPPDEGTVLFAGDEISSFSEQQLSAFRRSALGFVFQAFNLIETLTIAENIAIPLHLNTVPRPVISKRINELLSSLGIEAHADKFPDMLSGGEQQRAAIARALAHRPKLVVADEPTGNLDDHTAVNVMDLLTQECRSQGASLIIATHSDEVSVRSDRTLQLTNSRLETVA